MNQTRKHSMIESVTNVMVGYFVALASQLVIFPLFGINVTLKDNIMIGLYFTVISIVRSYCLRRWFTRRVGEYSEFLCKKFMSEVLLELHRADKKHGDWSDKTLKQCAYHLNDEANEVLSAAYLEDIEGPHGIKKESIQAAVTALKCYRRVTVYGEDTNNQA